MAVAVAVARALPRGEHTLAIASTRVPAEVVVRGAGAFGRDHARADWSLRRARGAEHLAFPGLEHSLEHLAALARLGVGDTDAGHGEHLLRVEIGELVLHLERALADEAEPAPLEMRAQLEDSREHFERLRIAVIVHDALVLVLDLAPSLEDLPDDHVHTLEDVERLETDDDHRLVVRARDELEGPDPHHRRHVTRAEETVELEVRRVEDRLHRRDDRDVVAEHEEVAQPLRLRAHQRQRGGWRRGLEPDRVEHYLAVRVLVRDLQRVERRVHHAHIGAGGLGIEQAPVTPRHAHQVAEAREDHPGLFGDGDAVIEPPHRDDTDWTTRTMHELDVARQQVLDPVLEDRVGVPTAHLHDLPVLVPCLAGDARGERARKVGVAKLVGELHAGGPPLPLR